MASKSNFLDSPEFIFYYFLPMRILIILFFLVFYNCTDKSSNMQIFIYKDSHKSELNNSELNLNLISTTLNSMLKNTDDIIRLYMDAERYETLLSEEMCVEFIFKEEQIVNSSKLGELRFTRVLIPFSGDFAGNENSSNIMIFIGLDEYFPEPLSNSIGYKEALKLKREFEKVTR